MFAEAGSLQIEWCVKGSVKVCAGPTCQLHFSIAEWRRTIALITLRTVALIAYAGDTVALEANTMRKQNEELDFAGVFSTIVAAF